MPKDPDDHAEPDLTELLASGRDTPPPFDAVAAVLAAAAAPPTHAELAGSEAAGIRLAAVGRVEGTDRREKGMTGMWRNIRRRVPNVVLGVIIGMMVGGGAFAVAQTVGNGGPKPRYHDKKACNLVDTGTLSGNWTHGDYVSAVEKKDPSKVREAAQSDCGKPVKGAKGTKGPKPKKSNEPEEASKSSTEGTKKPSAAPSPKPTPTATNLKSPEPSPSPSTTSSVDPTST